MDQLGAAEVGFLVTTSCCVSYSFSYYAAVADAVAVAAIAIYSHFVWEMCCDQGDPTGLLSCLDIVAMRDSYDTITA
jgi:hypothetical protein